ncbi:MAG TPA: c-type cytochrome domain-containing protein [Kofleriaceae bacterium]|nr:c-type cytochrome domain-containing protein [Kofleriaceae bacterium]
MRSRSSIPIALILGIVVALGAGGASVAHADASRVLQKYCARCHTGKRAQGDLDFILDAKRLVAEGLVVPGDAPRSLLYRRIADGEMPPAAVKARPSVEELAQLEQWIVALGTSPGVPVRRARDLDRLLANDYARLSARDRVTARYFSIAHLANAGASAAELDRVRVALQTLLASVTWSAAPPPVVAIDPERTLFRIDLRELGWTTELWDQVRASYPYGIARGTSVPDAIRADWFIATASRPPLYHALLELPATEQELAARLGIDLQENIATRRVARAGFTRSGVSNHNRVIERHVTRHGALWRSYDFSSSIDQENVFAHPLDFVPAGGELIFNLPDGMQAYMLVDATGRRIDKAPTKIVSDPRRPDRAVENGLSCIGCHASGILAKADQIRDTAGNFDELPRLRILQLYPSATTMSAHFDADRARFAKALAAFGMQPTADASDEPITLVTTRYEAELDLRTAAAELGLPADELEPRLQRSPSLRQALAALVRRGTVKRDAWAQLFPRIVHELALGVPFTPHASADAAPVVWIDGAHRTWIPLSATTDQATAISQCRARGYELPREAELLTAMSDGLASGLGLRGSLWTAGTKLDASNQRYGTIVDAISGQPHRAGAAEHYAIVCVQR